MGAYARLSPDEQRAINTLKSLFIFMRLTPDEALAQDPKFAMTASYVLHFLLKTGDATEDAKLANSLKHQDGGKSLILSRIEPLFRADRGAAIILLSTAEKVFKAIAKSERNRNGGLSSTMRNLIVKTCFTTPEGMLEHYYTRERREVTVMVDEKDHKGRIRKTPKKRLVNGFRVPALQLGEDLLTPMEKSKLKMFEHRFSMPKLAKSAKVRFIAEGGDPKDLTERIKSLVRDGYAVSTLISTVLKQRKRSVRAEALTSGAQASKLTPVQWLEAAGRVLATAQQLPENTYEEIERFLQAWECDSE
jgi:hypothetical protein